MFEASSLPIISRGREDAQKHVEFYNRINLNN